MNSAYAASPPYARASMAGLRGILSKEPASAATSAVTSTLGLAVLAVLAPQVWQHPVFDNRWLNGVGLVTHKPVTEDYAPLLPWMGMVWMGLAVGPQLRRLHLPEARITRALACLGQWPLTLYMLHQPLFWGLLLLLSR